MILKILMIERIEELMKIHELNQVKLAEKTGIAQSTISSWLLRKKEPSVTSLWALADFFETTIDYIVGRIDTL